MSKSLKRVRRVLAEAGHDPNIKETALARTAADAASALNCSEDEIAKSIIFKGEISGEAVLFLTAGGNTVDVDKAAELAGEPLGKADADLVRAQTGFAIGGVSPIGHLSPIRAWFDPRLLDFHLVWAAAGTPHHVFGMAPEEMQSLASASVADFAAQR